MSGTESTREAATIPGMADDESLETVLRTQNLPELMVVKGLLESVGIPFEVQGEVGLEMMPLRGAGPFGSRGTFAILRVRAEDREAALEIIQAPTIFEDDEFQGPDEDDD